MWVLGKATENLFGNECIHKNGFVQTPNLICIHPLDKIFL